MPKEAKVGALKGFHWVPDAHYMCVPKGVSDDKLAVLLDLMNYMLQPARRRTPTTTATSIRARR